MRILITGGTGQVGCDCQQVLGQTKNIVALSSRELDIADAAAVEAAIAAIRPDVVVNCAAFTQVDACETQQERAMAVNAAGPEHLARSLARHGGHLVHLSTDYVFDGAKAVPAAYSEDDPPRPLSWYGRSKLEGERRVLAILDRHTIVRTAWVYGAQGQNFLKKMLHLAVNVRPPRLRVVDDQYGSPTWSWRLAQQLDRLIEAGSQGLYHATAEGHCTWYALAGNFLERMGVEYPVEPCTTADYPTPAPRPRNSILANGRLIAAGLNLMRPWQDDVAAFVEQYRDLLLAAVQASRKALSGAPSAPSSSNNGKP